MYRKVGAIDSIPIEPEPLFDVEKDAQIHLYTLENPFKAQRLITNNTFSITTSNFNPKVPTRIFIHGFQSGQGFTGSLKKGNFISYKLYLRNRFYGSL